MTETALEAIIRQYAETLAVEAMPVRHVRVTTNALRGSIVTVPIPPGRADDLGYGAAPGGRLWREVIVHPADWADVKIHARDELQLAGIMGNLGIDRLYGVPVIVDPT